MRLLVLCLAVIAGCSPLTASKDADGSPSEEVDGGYQYPGCGYMRHACDDAPLFCASRVIQDRFNECETAADCARADRPAGDCLGVYSCEDPLVNRANTSAFLAEVEAAFSGYCSQTTCTGGASCAGGRDGGVSCNAGHCQWIQWWNRPDAGVDAGP